MPETPTCKLGDVCSSASTGSCAGDSTKAADVVTLMSGEQADMVWTDPRITSTTAARQGKSKTTRCRPEQFDGFLRRLLTSAADVLVDGGAIYVAHSEAGDGMAFRSAFRAVGFKLACCLIWRKNQLVMGRGDYHWQHEPILYGWKPTGKHHWYGNRKQTSLFEHYAGAVVQRVSDNVWQVASGDSILRISGTDVVVEDLASSIISVPKPQRSELHPTMKPVALVERMIANSSPRGGLVVDLCGGSGTTLIASDRLARRCNLMEYDPKYADVIILRWQELTAASPSIP